MMFCAGVQLPPRLAHAHLHDPARGGRQADLVRVHRRFCAERSPGAADGLLLGHALGKGKGEAEGGSDSGALVRHDDINAEEQRADDSPPGLRDDFHLDFGSDSATRPRVIFLRVNKLTNFFLCDMRSLLPNAQYLPSSLLPLH